MSGSTGVMVNVKLCVTFRETSAAIKGGCRVTRIVTMGHEIGAGKRFQLSEMKIWPTKEEMKWGKG
jgi:hypothetical protein